MNLHRIIAALFSSFRHQHKFRRARKSEDQALKYCRGCGESRAVRKRKIKE